MQPDNQRNATITRSAESVLSTHSVLRNTYMLLSMTLLFSAGTATLSTITNPSFLYGWTGLIITIGGMIGLLFLTSALRNSPWGLLSVFAFTGFMGYTLGPMLNSYIHNFSNGYELIMMSLGSTGLVFLSLSAYILTTRKDFSFLGGMLFTGIIIMLIGSIAAMIFKIPALSLGISAVSVFIFSGYILYDTSRIIHNGETNYIMATISLYIDIYGLFVNLLHLISAFSGNRN